LGKSLEAQGNLPEALEVLGEGLTIAARLAETNSHSHYQQFEIIEYHLNLARRYLEAGDKINAQSAVKLGQANLALMKIFHSDSERQRFTALKRQIAQLNNEIAKPPSQGWLHDILPRLKRFAP